MGRRCIVFPAPLGRDFPKIPSSQTTDIMQKRPSVKRWNPVLGEWVVIAPATAARPWSGAMVEDDAGRPPVHDPSCYLCPDVERAGGGMNPDYTDVFVFDNDFPSLSLEQAAEDPSYSEFDQPAQGVCRVVCFSPRHDLTLAEMSVESVYAVLCAFRDQAAELSVLPEIAHVLPFENKGAVIGVSNPHPHGQIYATDFVPRIPLVRYQNAAAHLDETGRCLFCDILETERGSGARVVAENAHFTAFVPYFARHSFESVIMPHRHTPSITDLSDVEMHSLAAIYSEMLIRYDNLFRMPFPNITIFRLPPCADGFDTAPCHFQIEFSPPLRSRDKLKYMAGFETGGGNIVNPSLPEESAEALVAASTLHHSSEKP